MHIPTRRIQNQRQRSIIGVVLGPGLLGLGLLALAACHRALPVVHARDLTISDAVITPASGAGRISALFVTIDNNGPEDRLIGLSSPVADKIELHITTTKDGLSQMRRTDGIVIPGNGAARLASGGAHAMLFGVKADPRSGRAAGKTVPVTLNFARNGPVEIVATFAHGGHHHGQDDRGQDAHGRKGHDQHK